MKSNINYFKHTSGKLYKLIYHPDGVVTLELTYKCPYCMQLSTERLKCEEPHVVEEGYFFKNLTCEHCREVASVTYRPEKRIF